MSKEGARPQLANKNTASTNPHSKGASIYTHGRAFLAPAWMESPARKARSASAVSTCVRARMSCERAWARTFWAAVTSSRLRTP